MSRRGKWQIHEANSDDDSAAKAANNTVLGEKRHAEEMFTNKTEANSISGSVEAKSQNTN